MKIVVVYASTATYTLDVYHTVSVHGQPNKGSTPATASWKKDAAAMATKTGSRMTGSELGKCNVRRVRGCGAVHYILS